MTSSTNFINLGSDPSPAEVAEILAEVKAMWAALIDVARAVPGSDGIVEPRKELPPIVEHIFGMAARTPAAAATPRNALDRAAYALFQLKRFADMPQAAIDFCREQHAEACKALNEAPPSAAPAAPVATAFNAAIDFALDEAGPDGLMFLECWREGAWPEIAEAFPTFKGPFPTAAPTVEPIGYAVVMENGEGPFVGCYRMKDVAEACRDRQPEAHNDVVIPVYAAPSNDAMKLMADGADRQAAADEDRGG